MLVAITIGHAGRPSRWADRGVVRGDVEEVSAVRSYVDALDHELRRAGHQVVLLSDGEYPEQWARADRYGADVYLNCHVNAGGGDYGLVVFDHRSSKGKTLAERVAAELQAVLGCPVRARPGQPDTNGAPRDADLTEAWNCIRGVDAVALCLEPYFIDGPKSGEFLGRLGEVGRAVGRGVW